MTSNGNYYPAQFCVCPQFFFSTKKWHKYILTSELVRMTRLVFCDLMHVTCYTSKQLYFIDNNNITEHLAKLKWHLFSIPTDEYGFLNYSVLKFSKEECHDTIKQEFLCFYISFLIVLETLINFLRMVVEVYIEAIPYYSN